jgi:hypothetical protein
MWLGDVLLRLRVENALEIEVVSKFALHAKINSHVILDQSFSERCDIELRPSVQHRNMMYAPSHCAFPDSCGRP